MEADWTMVVLTAIYVVATICIYAANYISSKAAREQLEEMRKQYKEENRPRIEIELQYEKGCGLSSRCVDKARMKSIQKE